ncbi:MAG: 50S ribosomal protein L25/general stress protein Ctc [Bacteroidales bacterium]|nr:50S ribosomal protein L25/general stress protein Ctc [Bacteroidales bacterium]
MKIISMSGSLRESVGKKDAKKLRYEGKVPCVLYGGEKQIQFAMDTTEFKDLIFSPEIAFVEINIDGTVYKATLQDVQYHVVTGNILHADFLKIHDEKPIMMSVPVKTTGTSAGVLKGGVLAIKLRNLKVKALPGHMPENIVLDITKLDIGNSIKVNQIETENYTLLDSPNAVAVTIRMTRAAAAAAAAEKKAGK